MREIKFRGKRELNKVWVYGWYSAEYVYYPRILTIDDDYVVIPETVGQYTGLKDENDLELFEGDIFRAYEDEVLGIVEFVKGAFYAYWEDGEEELLSEVADDIVRMGNRFDNPELYRRIIEA